MNAKGSAKGVAGKDYWNAPAGFFQYGEGQWGFISDRGMINWKSKPPVKGQKVYGWNQITPNLKQRGIMGNMPEQQATPNPFVDDLYARNMAQLQLQRDQAVTGAEHNVAMLNFEKDQQERDATRDFKVDREQMSAGLGGAGLDGSGIAATTMGNAGSKFNSFLSDLATEQSTKVAKERADQSLARTAFDTTKAGELGLAKDRWSLEHPGAKLPVVQKGVFQKDGQWYYANPNTGVTTTWHKPGAAAPAKKPKYPNAKTFKNAQGVIKPIVRK